jgi:polysaccharide export outer membrane protein
MRNVLVSMLILAAAAGAQQNRAAPEGANLPAQAIGPSDLIAVSVYDAPEFSRTVRVGADGFIRLPMLKQRLKAEGLYPADLERGIAEALDREQLLVDPYVTVTMAEYHSRPIIVDGAVGNPLTFQAEGPTTLLEAIARAHGLSENAGQEILVTQTKPGPEGKPVSLTHRISVRGLVDNADPALNLVLNGGEEIRVPEASRIYVVGNVRNPNAYKVQGGSEPPSVMGMLALSQGLTSFYGKVAYIYRSDGVGKRSEIAVPLQKIMERKAPDVQLMADDIFYVPDRKGRRMTVSALERVLGFGTAAGTTLIYTAR